MINLDLIRQVALSLPETTEQPHFEKPSFKVGKKIFATYNGPHNRVCVKLSEIDQDVFSTFDSSIIYPVPNKWGKQGWTLINLANVPEETLVDALTMAYCEVAPKKLAMIVKQSRYE
ncbi:MmcQ/YjbR family DNA-binding protein [Spirosoma sp. KCTC 42546]|uniref:MmcQ/YjbR family DNA-binding protein n=1 Tax=Spirosoma sp. KCTC 42546 TaxID=2520506 RepID=UPI00115A0935|nr:MmcQ/YjbR family DNA-binding protein [Spirosoma sp. KCTC 42546]QDK78277.1 MmcQ/YjbR family DNA-binding protein [Spirosoma sp. KCTC 42546]